MVTPTTSRLTAMGKRIYKRRKETVERSFADSKEMHGLRYARYRSLRKVRAQCLLTAACQNMKKIALILHRRDKLFGPRDPNDPNDGLLDLIFRLLQALQNGLGKVIFRKIEIYLNKKGWSNYCPVT